MKKLTNKKRMILAGLLCGGMLASASVGGALCVQAAEAAPSFAIVEAASIRSNAPAGIRFATQILITEYEELEQKNAVYGTVVYPQHLLGEAELTVETAGAVNVAATKWTALTDDEKTAIDESLYYQYNAVLVGEYDEATDTYAGLPEQMYGVKLVARSYVTYDGENGDKVTEYVENTSIRSIADVAKGALLDTTRTYSTDEIAYFHDITDYVADTVSAVSVNTVEETIEATVPVSAEYGAVLAVYEQASGAKITDWSYADNALTFDADFLKSLPYGEYNLKVLTENGVFVLPTTIYGEVEDTERLFGFDNSASVANAKYESTPEWLAEYQGEKGVLKFTIGNVWTGLQLALPYTVSQLEEMSWDYFDIRMYTEMDGDIYEGVWPSATKGAWGTVRLSKEQIISIFGDVNTFYGKLVNGINNESRLFAFWNSGTMYLDYVDFKTSAEVDFSGVANFADEDSVDEVYYGSNSGEWLDSYEGATGVIKGAYSGDWVGIQFRLNTTAAKLAEMNWNYVEFKVAVDFANSSRTSWDGLYSNKAGWAYTTVGVWRIYKATKDGIITQYGSVENFYKAITVGTGSDDSSRLFVLWNMNTHGNFYFDYFKLGYEEIAPEFDGKDDFVNKATLLNVVGLSDAQWLESYEGATGVIKGAFTGDWGGFKFKLNTTKEKLAAMDWDSVEFKITADFTGSRTAWDGLYSNKAGWTYTEDGVWRIYSATKDGIITQFGSLDAFYEAITTGSTGMFTLWNLTAHGNFYFDYFQLVKNA